MPDELLSIDQSKALLGVARRALTAHFAGERAPVFELDDSRLHQPAGAFVTLRRRAPQTDQLALRGCIGTFEQDRALVQTVARMAVLAATNDPRFMPVVAEELPELVIEISVLSPRRRARPEEVVVGRHGIQLTRGGQRGVLLPQVAIEYGWERETFLDQTCRKAGLPAGSWQDSETIVEVFTAQVFSEEERQ